MRIGALVVTLAAIAACFTPPPAGDNVEVACTSGDDCPGGRVCLEQRVCVDAGAACIDVNAQQRTATAQPDGNRCGDDGDDGDDVDDGLICAGGACVEARCGDGIVSGAETCDGGGGGGGDGAGAECRDDCTACGDGVVDDGDGEECDDGAANSDDEPGACRSACVRAKCGDGTVDLDEECDDGAANSDSDPDACRASTCERARCGDGVIDDDEVCDDQTGACVAACLRVVTCGDAVVDVPEQCDDDNDNPSDGCNACSVTAWASRVLVSGAVEGRVATSMLIGAISVAFDRAERLFIGDVTHHVVRRLDDDGTLTTIAGNGVAAVVGSTSGDGGPAAQASLDDPLGIAVDGFGRVFIADALAGVVRRVDVDVDGTITTVAGDPALRDTREIEGPALASGLSAPSAVAVDADGGLFIADANNHSVAFIDATTGELKTVVGTGRAEASLTSCATATPGSAFGRIFALALDPSGALVFADEDSHCVFRLDKAGGGGASLAVVAGTGVIASGDGTADGDGGDAGLARLSAPTHLAYTAGGDLLIQESGVARLRRIAALSNVISTQIAPFAARSFALDNTERVIVIDAVGARVSRLEFDGTPTRLAGTDGVRITARPAATSFDIRASVPGVLALDPGGHVVVVDVAGSRILRVDDDGGLTTIAGVGIAREAGAASDGALAVDVPIAFTQGNIAVGADGRVVFFSTGQPSRTRAVDGVSGVVSTLSGVAGTTYAITGAGDVLTTTTTGINNERAIARIDESGGPNQGRLVIVAGGGDGAGGNGDLGPAVGAHFEDISQIAPDARGGFYVADNSGRIRYVDSDDGTGTITTVAGDGTSANFAPDGALAATAPLSVPSGVAVLTDGNGAGSDRVFIADSENKRVRFIDAAGLLRTLAGTDDPGGVLGVFSGDGGDALAATLDFPTTLAVDAAGNVFFTQGAGGRAEDIPVVRRVDAASHVITTVAGAIHPPGPGDFDHAALLEPRALLSLSSTPSLTLAVGGGDAGRLLYTDDTGFEVGVGGGHVDVVAGYANGPSAATNLASFAPLFVDPRGLAFDAATSTLLVVDRGAPATPAVHAIHVTDPADPSTWTTTTTAQAASALGFRSAAGAALDEATGTLFIADDADHCVKSVNAAGSGVPQIVVGVCGVAGTFNDLLDRPAAVAVSPASGALYVADTGNNRVLRYDLLAGGGGVGAVGDVVIGDGSRSSAGEGAPARAFPIDTPGQIAVDVDGNLFVTSRTSVRLVANVDGDADADGDDVVITIYGGQNNAFFPENATQCLAGLTLVADGRVQIADACLGFLVELDRINGR